MNSRLYRAELFHQRIPLEKNQGVSHRFRYPLTVFAFDLDELALLDQQLAWFGYNRKALVSLWDRDYLGDVPALSLRAKVESQVGREFAQVVLVTCPRVLGYAFNPVSFWFCWNGQGELDCLLAEVNNTFGERHYYLLDQPLTRLPGSTLEFRFEVPKDFFVSPFNDTTGTYEFRLNRPSTRLDIRLRVFRGEERKLVFNSWLRGSGDELREVRPWSARLWTGHLTWARIHWEGALLYFLKKLPLVDKPRPTSKFTLRAEPPSWLHRKALTAVTGLLSNCRRGHQVWDLPDGRQLSFGETGVPEDSRVRVLNWDFFVRLLWDGDVALGDGWVAAQWESPDLVAMLEFLILNREFLDDRSLGWTRSLAQALGRFRHWRRRNSLGGSRRNIAAHYDLGNSLYERFLDASMLYSCAFFEQPQSTLEQAQAAKLERLLRWSRLNPECHLLDIGCGWGTLAIEAARRFGCSVTGITLSQEQLDYALQKVAEAGLQDRVQLKLCDYRHVQGRYDRIVSCEMLEAVGHENFPAFFAACDRLLRPEGLLVVQVISSPDVSYETYRRNQDWIQKEIFPGGLCPSLTAWVSAATRSSQLVLEHMENLAPHYARTLAEWRQRFVANWEQIAPHGYDERFRRAWLFYLQYCQAAFSTRNLGLLQMVWTRPQNRTLACSV